MRAAAGMKVRGATVVATLAIACLALTALGAERSEAALTIEGFSGSVRDSAGQPANLAGAHPFEASTSFSFPMNSKGLAAEDLKTSVVSLPPGFVGNPLATPRCEEGRTVNYAYPEDLCPASSQVGVVAVRLAEGVALEDLPVYNLEPPPGVPGRFGFNVIFPDVFIEARVRPDDFGIDVIAPDANQALNVTGVDFTFWGVPAAEAHDDKRIGFGCDDTTLGTPCRAGVPEKPFLTNPMNCSAGPLTTRLRVDSWQSPGVFDEASFDHDDSFSPPVPMAVHGCAELDFRPQMSVRPASSAADSPTGLRVELGLPQSEDPDGRASAHLKRAEVILPDGMAVNPAAAGGLGACSPVEIGVGNEDPVRCPDSSKIGTLSIETPLLEEPMQGEVYLATQGDNPFGSLLALYLVARGPGVLVKLPGEVTPNPVTGQLTTSFDNNPQLPFERMSIDFFGGPRAALLTPPRCGSYEIVARLSPWSATDPDSPTAEETVTSTSSFQLSSGSDGGACPSGGFDPRFEAGSANPLAGAYSPLLVNASRPDGSQVITGLDVLLPPGLTGKLAGVPYCPEAALAALAARPGRAEAASPSCPAASRVGRVDAGVGAGSMPFHVPGQVYLAGPYKGAPLSLAVVTPAVAGPFDLGTVLVRAALAVNPVTARINAVSDPIPTILQGIPLQVRSVAVATDRPQFTLNPTSCDPMAISAKLAGRSASRSLDSRFQAASCERLPFKPRLSLKLKGKTRRSAYQQLRAELKAKPGQANIGRAAVTMPRSIFLAQEHIRTICTRVQFAADACPKGSVYGHARAFTPLLDQPLEGPVYLRANGGERELPDLVADLRGQIAIELVGFVDSVNGGIRTRFQNVPDAPVSRFVLNMRGGRKSLLVSSRNLCRSGNRANVKMDGQNGKVHDLRPRLKVRCGKSAKGKSRGS